MLKFSSLLAWILVLFIPCSSYAVRVVNLYQTQMPVVAQTYDVREQAVQQAFAHVIMRLTGDPVAINNPKVQENLSKANYFVQEYSYSVPTTSTYQYLLNIRFDKDGINHLIKEAGLSLWGENRPLLLVWVVMNTNADSNNGDVMGTTNPTLFLKEMLKQSKRIGLPLIFPMMDVAEMTEINAADVVEMNIPTLKTAAKRYEADGLLIGNLETSNNSIQSRWLLVLGDQEWGWKLDATNPEALASDIATQAATTVVKNYIVKADAPTTQVKLMVMNVNAQQDLGKVLQYLKQVTAVKQLQLSKISGTQVELSLQIAGSLDTFQKNAELNKRLVLKSQDATNNILVYQWVP